MFISISIRTIHFICLHDCCADRILIEKGKISFDFADGFWITPDHKCSNFQEVVKTDSAKVEFFLEESFEEIIVYIFRKGVFGKTIRETWTIQKLVDFVNNKANQLEFLYHFKQDHESLFQCELHFNKRPFRYVCQIEIPVVKIVYKWDNLCPDRTW